MGGTFFPVVCAAPLSKEVLDRFIRKNGVDDDDWCCVFVDSLDNYYDEESQSPIEADSSPNSPFIGKIPEECHKLLLKLRGDTESEIMTDIFAILDERSAKDDTVLLACAERYDGGENEVLAVRTLRATFKASCTAMMLYHSGHSSVEEDAERTEREEDNVYRGQWSKVV